MWKIDSPREFRRRSASFRKHFYNRPPFYFYMSNARGEKLVSGISDAYLDPDPLWSYGFKLGARSIWYLDPHNFYYVKFQPHNERQL